MDWQQTSADLGMNSEAVRNASDKLEDWQEAVSEWLSKSNWGPGRLAWLLSGGALVGFGAMRRSKLGIAMAAGGGYLIYRGFRGSTPGGGVYIAKSVTINRPVEEVYRFWRDFENLPRFMRHLKSVRRTEGDTWEWTAAAPIKREVQWTARLVDEQPNKHLAWESLEGSDVEHRGWVDFVSAPGNRGTEVHVRLDFEPPAGAVGRAFAMIFGEDPEQQIREDLRRFKALLEAGEIPTTEGQPHGRRSRAVRTLEPFDREQLGNRELRPRKLATMPAR